MRQYMNITSSSSTGEEAVATGEEAVDIGEKAAGNNSI